MKTARKVPLTPLTVMAIHSLNCHLSNRSFLAPSISYSITCFLFPLYAVGKLQKYLWVVILVIYLKHLLLHYGMLIFAVTHLSVLIMSIFQSLIASFDLDSQKLSHFFFLLPKILQNSDIGFYRVNNGPPKTSLVAQLVKICLQCRKPWFVSWVGKIHWRRDRLPTPVFLGFPGSSAGKESTCKAGDLGSIPGLGRYPGEGNGYPLQYSGLEDSVDREAWQATFHGVPKSWTRLNNFHFHYFQRHLSPNSQNLLICYLTW